MSCSRYLTSSNSNSNAGIAALSTACMWPEHVLHMQICRVQLYDAGTADVILGVSKTFACIWTAKGASFAQTGQCYRCSVLWIANLASAGILSMQFSAVQRFKMKASKVCVVPGKLACSKCPR